MLSPRRRTANARVLGLLAAAGLAALAADARADDVVAPPGKPGAPITFTQRPGVMEFSGFLTVRPIQPEAWLARGVNARAAAQRVNAARARVAATAAKVYPEIDSYVIPVPKGSTESALATQLMATGDYEYATPDWTCYPLSTPNDPQFAGQWHHATIHSEMAWDVTPGSRDILIAFCDTGVDLSHPDLVGFRVPGYNAASNLAEVDGGDIADINGHGTHVAGIGAAIGNNAVGVAGANLTVQYMMCRVTNSPGGGAAMSDLMEAARWAADHGARSVSVSYSGVSDPSIQTTGAYIRGLGKILLYAAGNDAANLSSFDYADVIVVGASDQGDNRAGFSAYGRAVDVFSPGTDILSTCNGGGYCTLSGTSMATPLANGIVGLIWSADPSAGRAAVQNALFLGCVDLGDPGNDDTYGWGRVDSFRSMQSFLGGAPRAPYAVDDAVTAFPGGPVTVDVLANDFDLNASDIVKLQSFDASSAQGGTITLCEGCGPSGRDVLRYSAPGGYFGADTFSYTARDLTNRTDTATVNVTVADASAFRAPENPLFSRPSIDVDYYVTAGYSQLPNFGALTPYATDAVANINYPSTGGVYATSGRSEEVGAVYRGYISIPSPGVYTLYTNSDDGSRLYIGDTMVVNNDGLHGMVEQGGAISLQAGLHAVRVEFWENFGGAGLIVSIAGPGMTKQVVPASMFKRDWCPVDWDNNGTINSTDISEFINSWFNDQSNGTLATDINADGVSNSTDVSDLINAYFDPPAGCP